jgi:hypothetical protein
MNTNSQADSFLLVSSSERRFEMQKAIEATLHSQVVLAVTFAEASQAVAISPYRAMILDEALADLDPAGADQFLAHCIEGFPIFVKLAITGLPRCLQQIQLALRRFEREQKSALLTAQHLVRSQMRDALTSIFICAQLALKTPELPPEAARHINSVIEAGEALQSAIAPVLD